MQNYAASIFCIVTHSYPMNFGHKLKSLMALHGETTRSLGDQVGVTSAAVSGWCAGAKPRPSAAKQLAAHFSVTVDDLLDDSREIPNPANRTTPEQMRHLAELHDRGKLGDSFQKTQRSALHSTVSPVSPLVADRRPLGEMAESFPSRLMRWGTQLSMIAGRVFAGHKPKEVKEELRQVVSSLEEWTLPDWWEKVPSVQHRDQLQAVLPEVYARLLRAAEFTHEEDRLIRQGKKRRPEHEHPLIDALHDLKLEGTGFTRHPDRAETIFRTYQDLVNRLRYPEHFR